LSVPPKHNFSDSKSPLKNTTPTFFADEHKQSDAIIWHHDSIKLVPEVYAEIVISLKLCTCSGYVNTKKIIKIEKIKKDKHKQTKVKRKAKR